MITREVFLSLLLDHLAPKDLVVAGLGNMARALYAATPAHRSQCLYCMGSMGSVVPVALGLVLAGSPGDVFAIEGDGGILMNLGALVTAKRYADNRLRILIWDNRCYESTGGQLSQPPGFDLSHVAQACGLQIWDIHSEEQLSKALAEPCKGPSVMVVKGALGEAAPRIADDPGTISLRFRKGFHTLRAALN